MHKPFELFLKPFSTFTDEEWFDHQNIIKVIDRCEFLGIDIYGMDYGTEEDGIINAVGGNYEELRRFVTAAGPGYWYGISFGLPERMIELFSNGQG